MMRIISIPREKSDLLNKEVCDGIAFQVSGTRMCPGEKGEDPIKGHFGDYYLHEDNDHVHLDIDPTENFCMLKICQINCSWKNQ